MMLGSHVALALSAAILCGAGTSVHAAAGRLPIPGGSLRVTQRGAATVVTVTLHGRTMRTVLPADEGIFAGSLDTSRVVGVVADSALILSSDYASRPAGGAHMCGAGTETVLRVIALRHGPRQTFHRRIASCWRTIEAGEVGWDAGTGRLSLERTTFDASGARDLRTVYRIGPEGDVTQMQVERRP